MTSQSRLLVAALVDCIIMEISFLRWLGMAALCGLWLAAACSGDDEPPVAAPSSAAVGPIPLTLTAEPARATAAALLPTATPTPEPLVFGKVERFWVYPDAPAAETCAELVEWMIPFHAPSDTPGRVVECATGSWWLDGGYVRRRDGVLHLTGLVLLLLFDDRLPDEIPFSDCKEIAIYMLRSSADPRSIDDGGDARYKGVCDYTPPVRGQAPSQDILIWSEVDRRLAPPDLAPDLPCQSLIRYYGGPGDANLDQIAVTCRLQLP